MLVYLPFLFVAIFGGMGLIAGGTLWSMRRRYRDLLARGISVDGVVVKNVEVGNNEDSFHVIYVEFHDQRGQRHRVRSKGGSSLFPGPGIRTKVYYFPEDPAGASLEADRANGEIVLQILAYAFGGVGLLALIAQVITLLVDSAF